MFAGLQNGLAKLYNSYNGELIHTFYDHKERINAVKFCPSSLLVVSGGDDCLLMIFNVQKG